MSPASRVIADFATPAAYFQASSDWFAQSPALQYTSQPDPSTLVLHLLSLGSSPRSISPSCPLCLCFEDLASYWFALRHSYSLGFYGMTS